MPDSVCVPVPTLVRPSVPVPSTRLPEKAVDVLRPPVVSTAAPPVLCTVPAPASEPIEFELPPVERSRHRVGRVRREGRRRTSQQGSSRDSRRAAIGVGAGQRLRAGADLGQTKRARAIDEIARESRRRVEAAGGERRRPAGALHRAGARERTDRVELPPRSSVPLTV